MLSGVRCCWRSTTAAFIYGPFCVLWVPSRPFLSRELQEAKFTDRFESVKRAFDPTVQTLDLSRSSLVSVDGLTDLKALQTLNLSSCYHLHDVNGLKNLKALQMLDLSDCIWLANVDGLKGTHRVGDAQF